MRVATPVSPRRPDEGCTPAAARLRRPARFAAGLLLALFAGLALALEPMDFADAQEEARFRDLVAELRCVMCQNQSLSDSDAPIARDLRAEVLRLMQDGYSDAQIKDHLVERYTEFVLYRPPLRAATWALWFGPALLLGIGAAVVFVVVRRRAAKAPPSGSADHEEESQEW